LRGIERLVARLEGAAVIQGLFNNGALPVLERMAQFTQARHQVIVNNIANLSTPNYRPQDLDTDAFRAVLADAIDRRRAAHADAPRGDLRLDDTDQVDFRRDGIAVRAADLNENILFHDRNNRSLERTMQDLAENTMAFTHTMEMLRNQFTMLETAISERV
jgi:flagellar basal-body rod protein FlgB